MAHPGTITNLRFLKRNNLHSEQDLQKNYFREIIHSYGIDCYYFRHDANFFEQPSAIYVNYVYGEKTTMSYWLSSSMVVYMEMHGDSIILNKFGLETDADGSCFILIDDFTEKYRDIIGTEKQDTFNTIITGNVSAFFSEPSGKIYNIDLDGFTSSHFDFGTSGNFNGIYSGEFIRTPKLYNNYVYKSGSYNTRKTLGTLSGLYSCTVDESGNGFLSGEISGILQYHIEDPGKHGGPNWKIAPQVGDFFRLDFSDENHEEYEITRVYDRNLKSDGLNPLLSKYVWKCDVVRRDPSYESVVGDETTEGHSEEEFTNDRQIVADFDKIVSDQIFDYDKQIVDNIDDKIDLDKVYGDY